MCIFLRPHDAYVLLMSFIVSPLNLIPLRDLDMYTFCYFPNLLLEPFGHLLSVSLSHIPVFGSARVPSGHLIESDIIVYVNIFFII